MTTSLWAAIIDALNNFDFKTGNTVYVLSGFNYFLDKLDIKLSLKSDSFLLPNSEKIEIRKEFTQKLLNQTAPIILLRENYLLVKELIDAFGKTVVVIENDIYPIFVPNFQDAEIKEDITKLFEAESDITPDGGSVQITYDDVIDINGIQFVKYSNIGIDSNDVIEISGLIQNPSFDSGESLQVSEDLNEESATEIIHGVVENNIGVLYYYEEAVKNNTCFIYLKEALSRVGVDFRKGERRTSGRVIPEDRRNTYLEILRRKDQRYSFRDLKIYENPYESNKVIDISQEEIIDDIVSNAQVAQSGEFANDIFVTAPTGAGKSVMFQIPAIYLAEQYGLVTIIVSPLIALMNDQVNNIISMTDQAVAINGSYTPVEKEEALAKVKNGEKSILYLAPEALISHSSISDLIGDRRIGLIVVDEAHVVATWGKNFRPDCWYLGKYLNDMRRGSRAEQNFIIATFTATATFGSSGSMYDDIVNSLFLTPNKYIGYARRDDIVFDVKVLEPETSAYKEEKDDKAIESIKEIIETNKKCIAYTPYVKQTIELYAKLEKTGAVCRYYSGLSSEEKENAYQDIRSGRKTVILCTKAFGMGVDISDIEYIYHYAPTGNVADYVQEIGRAARLPGMTGIAKTDYFRGLDFKYINQLYGMSAIRNDQIIQCINKILSLYKKNGHRNFMVSSEDFAYIFGGAPKDSDGSYVDNKLKTALLMIKKDFEINDRTHSFAPIIFKPRSMFAYGYFAISDEFFEIIRRAGYDRYFKDIANRSSYKEYHKYQSPVIVRQTKKTYELNYRKLWEERYRKLSFAEFKWRFNRNELEGFDFKVGEELGVVIIVNASCKKYKNFSSCQEELNDTIDSIKEALDKLKFDNIFFTREKLVEILMDYGAADSKRKADTLSSMIINLLPAVRTGSVVTLEGSFIARKRDVGAGSSKERFRITNNSYVSRLHGVKTSLRSIDIDNGNIFRFFPKNSGTTMLFVYQLLDALELANVELKIGDRPEYFIRVNNPSALERIIMNPAYFSYSVKAARQRHELDREYMRHLFEDLKTDEERWGFIEEYFLGQLDELKGAADYSDVNLEENL